MAKVDKYLLWIQVSQMQFKFSFHNSFAHLIFRSPLPHVGCRNNNEPHKLLY